MKNEKSEMYPDFSMLISSILKESVFQIKKPVCSRLNDVHVRKGYYLYKVLNILSQFKGIQNRILISLLHCTSI